MKKKDQRSKLAKKRLQKRWPKYTFRLRTGKGTGSGWLHVYTNMPESLHNDVVDEIKNLASEYYTDYGTNDSYVPCVNVYPIDHLSV